MNRGKAEADALAKADTASATAHAALAKAEIVAEQLAEARIEFARDYASHKDMAAAEMRYAGSGYEGPAASMPQGTRGFDIITRSHAEGHAAALMRDQKIL